MIKKLLTTIVLILITSILVAGCTSSSNTTPQTSSQASNVGKGLEIYATPVANPPQVSSAGHVTPKSGNEWVAFNCTVKNVNAQPLPGQSQKYISDGYWVLVDRGGHIYYDLATALVQGTPGITTFEPSYTSPGSIVNGYVFFEVPSGSAFNYIYYDDGGVHLEIPL